MVDDEKKREAQGTLQFKEVAFLALLLGVCAPVVVRLAAFPEYTQATKYGAWGIGLTFGLWCYMRGIWHWMKRRDIAEKVMVLLGVIAVSPHLAVAALVGIPEFINGQTLKATDAELRAFREDAKDGYPALKRMALENFNVAVTLSNSKTTWLKTRLSDSGELSPAQVDQGPGFCELAYSKSALLRDFGIADPRLTTLWVKGVLIHETGHCVDAQRDFLTAQVDHKVQANSLAPGVRDQVSTVFDYAAWSGEDDSRLWKEVFSDMMEIGWWKLNAKADEEQALTAALLRQREASKERDKTHATGCWIRLAQRTSPPKGMGELIAWSDALRSRSECSVELTKVMGRH